MVGSSPPSKMTSVALWDTHPATAAARVIARKRFMGDLSGLMVIHQRIVPRRKALATKQLTFRQRQLYLTQDLEKNASITIGARKSRWRYRYRKPKCIEYSLLLVPQGSRHSCCFPTPQVHA